MGWGFQTDPVESTLGWVGKKNGQLVQGVGLRCVSGKTFVLRLAGVL